MLCDLKFLITVSCEQACSLTTGNSFIFVLKQSSSCVYRVHGDIVNFETRLATSFFTASWNPFLIDVGGNLGPMLAPFWGHVCDFCRQYQVLMLKSAEVLHTPLFTILCGPRATPSRRQNRSKIHPKSIEKLIRKMDSF